MRDFGPFDGLPSASLSTLSGFNANGAPLAGPDGQTPCQSLIPLTRRDIGCALATMPIGDTDNLLILGRIQPSLPVAELDGEQLVLEADKEVILRCGKSSITLTADGRVKLQGKQVLSRADGQNRVQGATVQLN